MKLLTASLVLYLLLGVTSLSVRRIRPDSQLRLQVDAWWWIFPIVSLALAAYPYGVLGLSILIGTLAARELSQFTYRSRPQFLAQSALVVATACLGLLNAARPAALLVVVAASLAMILFAAKEGQRIVWLLLLLTACSGSVITAFIDLPYAPSVNLYWMFYLFILTALNDIGQYVSGKLFGKRQIAPRISPNKTWQGLAGGVCMTLLVSLALGSWFCLAPPQRLIAYGLLMAPAGFLGDLLFSAAKRRLGIKDFSDLIPGHGGILDRVDSLVITAPLLYVLLRSIA